MKKIIPIFALLLSSCYYYPYNPPPQPIYQVGHNIYTQPQRNCTCGYVLNKGVDQWGNYFLEVQNQCSGNIKTFTFDKKDWESYKISDGICLPRNSSW